MRIATWNVNSVKQRVPRLLQWLDERRPDVLCLQELKLDDEAFAELLGDELEARGYTYAVHGEPRWNGVALLARGELRDVVRGLPGGPGFPHQEARAVAGTYEGIRFFSVYVPNGREPDSDHYRYKLDWLAALRDALRSEQDAPTASAASAASTALTHTAPTNVVCGDVNIAPTDADVYDPAAFETSTHVTPAERSALGELTGREPLGGGDGSTGSEELRDVMRERWPTERVFTYWDYRAGMFPKDLGMRIDLVLAGGPVADRARAAWVDRQARKGTAPSDHAPVVVDLDEAPDGDIGPMVPPPSARRSASGSRSKR